MALDTPGDDRDLVVPREGLAEIREQVRRRLDAGPVVLIEHENAQAASVRRHGRQAIHQRFESFQASLRDPLARAEHRPRIPVDRAVGAQAVARVEDRVDPGAAAGERLVPKGLIAEVGLLDPARDVRIVVGLVDGDDRARRIDDGALPARAPDEPVVEPGATDDEGRHRVEETGREDEVVDRGRTPRAALDERSPPQLGDGCGRPEVDVVHERQIARLADDEKPLEGGSDSRHGRQQVVEEDDVGVDEAAKRVLGDPIDPGECVVEPRRSAVAAGDGRGMGDAEIPGRLRDARIVPDQDHLNVLAQGRSSCGRRSAGSHRYDP